jgi:hypothetical protein
LALQMNLVAEILTRYLDAPSFPQLLERQTRMQRMSNDSRPGSSTNASRSPVLAMRPEVSTPRPSRTSAFNAQDYMNQPAFSDDESDTSEEHMVGRQSLLQVLGRARSDSDEDSDGDDNAFLPFAADNPPRTIISGTTLARDVTTPPFNNMQSMQQQTTPPARNVQRLRPNAPPLSRGGTNTSSVNPSPPSTVSMGSSFSDLSGKSRLYLESLQFGLDALREQKAKQSFGVGVRC